MKIDQLQKHYGNKYVLDDVSCDLAKHQAHGLLGANGAGKSTFIKILMGLCLSDSGKQTKPKAMSLLPENPYLPLNLTAFQIVSHACRIKKSAQAAEYFLEEVSLRKEVWHKPINTYSKGMKQRVSIAYALVARPEWLLLDEPMSGLDAMGRKQILDVFKTYKNDGVSLLMCSHSVGDLVRLCDVVHIMAKGKFCESIAISEHSMAEAEHLEERLMYWSADFVLD